MTTKTDRTAAKKTAARGEVAPKPGRPSAFKDEYIEQAAKLCTLGATDAELADFFGVSTRTIYRWKLENEAFCQALNVGKEHADVRVKRSLYMRATGYDYVEHQAFKLKVSQHEERVEVAEVTRHMPPDTTAAIFWLKNRDPQEWRDKQELEHSGNVTVEITRFADTAAE